MVGCCGIARKGVGEVGSIKNITCFSSLGVANIFPDDDDDDGDHDVHDGRKRATI